ncbi:amidohydrolase [Larkinella terrae]|uniref:Amidohydrolase n=1 Tax=Larkinella terrae TaxID=2025311 RepID=A0A7K0ETY6_9BACT|nr:amidohydrolase [Larkinella terrae]MRS65263.1 amidohydrolase [Larkinella terrae]
MRKITFHQLGILALSLFATQLQAQSTPTKEQREVMAGLDNKSAHYGTLSKQIWDWAEVGYQEEKSSALLQQELTKEGFTIKAGVAGIPTAFVATFGSGKPVIGILAEYDALPGITQDATPERKPIDSKKSGHACGHNLFGPGSVASAVAVKNWLQKTGKTGTIQLYGTPAEEGGSGKVYMVREGMFNNTDVVLHWHPADRNGADPSTSLANITAKFRFRGIAAHAAASPERGRSALDGVESMNYMINMMREHIPSDTRIHYVITKGGEAPNVVPDFAEVYYYVRHKNRTILQDVWKRMVKAAEGAGLGTETKMEYEIIGGVYNLLPVESLSKLMHKNLSLVGGVAYSPEETRFAEKLGESFGTSFGSIRKPGEAATVSPFSNNDLLGSASTDVGDVSWVVPTVGLSAATWVPGTAAHSWQAVAASGTSIGVKGMMVAAKSLALTAIDLFKDPALIQKAKADWQQARGADFKYEALLGNRKPALDYRK